MSSEDFEEIDLDPKDIEEFKPTRGIPEDPDPLTPKEKEDFTKIFTEVANTSTPPLNLITKDAVVVVGQVCHRRHADQPTSTVFQFSRELETEEQPYTRLCHKPKSKAKEEWLPLDTGWLEEEVSFLVIRNDEGGHTDVNLSEEEKESIKQRIIEIGIYNEDVTIPIQYFLPQESLPISPIDLDSYRIRCRKGTAKYTITAYPS
jgi:hypothetical protein